MYFLIMTHSIENICYEYTDDALFSQEESFDGLPVSVIIYLQHKYFKELSTFLYNNGYYLTSRKNTGKHFCLVRFELVNLSYYDQLAQRDQSQGSTED